MLKDKKELEEIIEDLENDLSSAEPIIYHSEKGLEQLESRDIREIKSMHNPPKHIETTLQAVMILLGLPQDWPSIKKFLASKQFLSSLKNFDKDNISEETLEDLDNFIEEHDLTDTEKIKKTSLPAANLAVWVNQV